MHDEELGELRSYFDHYSSKGLSVDNVITCLAGESEMLKISPEGFWVRGVKVEQGPGEAEAVYKAFREFMTWNIMANKS